MKKKTKDLQGLLATKIRALYDIESAILKGLPKMVKKTTDKKLKATFQSHLTETKSHARRLEKVFSLMGLVPRKTKSEAIRGILKDTEWVMANVEPGPALDTNLIAAARYVEHYEMAGYISASDWANALGLTDVVSLLEETLAEEETADEKLENLSAEGIIEAAVA